MTNPKPSRKRFRFALAIVVVFAAVSWLVALPAYQRPRAIREIERLGGIVRTEEGPEWLRDFVSKHRFGWVEYVDFSDTEITNDGLLQLSGLTNLKGLGLNGTQITDDGIKHLSGMTNLVL